MTEEQWELLTAVLWEKAAKADQERYTVLAEIADDAEQL